MSVVVAIVGRPNVGKSTFFNRLVGSRDAIVDEFSGVTRDRHYGKTEWNGTEFNLIDTGGYVGDSDEMFDVEIRKQVEIAIDEAHAIVFVVDVTTGIIDLDNDVANLLRKSKKPVFLVVNKVDNNERIADAVEFYSLGLGDYYCISSINGSGTGEILDALVESLPTEEFVDHLDGLPRFAVVGRPNAGKSSFINTILGEERNIVTPIAGTTRDTNDIRFKSFGFDFALVDTAGIRKKKKVNEDLEFYSVLRAIRALEKCDVAYIMIDAKEGIGSQDLNIIHLAHKNNKGIVILINKWDLIEEKQTNTARDFERHIKEKLEPFTDVDVLFISVKDKQRIHKALECGVAVHKRRTQKIKTSELNDFFLPIMEFQPPPAIKGKYIKVKYVTQLPTHYPTFAFYCNLPQYIKEPYKRFLENKLRDKYEFTGVPVTIYFRKK
ncbi:MAG: ribosome biogenesis GTPase Der [Crocinitomicaceae bacterium]|nr:ribosome biogenesis GTPase Der [Crocinitomicaceae bacterium]|tara:strand:+ start:4505 stop:5815 length:1311 start_codon:yes stop_codon:yes gene_type:complete